MNLGNPPDASFSIPGKFVSAIKHLGSSRVKVNIITADDSHAMLAFEHDADSIGDAYTELLPGTPCTISVSVP